MDKRIFTTRMKPTASDMNYIVNDSETSDWNSNKEVLFDTDTVQTGLIASTTGNNEVIVSAGRAFSYSDGARINVPAGATLKWDGTDGKACASNTNRMDLVSISHTYFDGSTQPRQFIDIDPTSSTYGQAYISNVVTNKTDYYSFTITSGTTTASKTVYSVPQCPSGTIPLFTTVIISGSSTNIQSANIDNNVFNRYRQNGSVKTLRDVTKTLCYDSGWQQVPATSGTVLTETAEKHLQPNIVLTVRPNSLEDDRYYTDGFFASSDNVTSAYSAYYDANTGEVLVYNNTNETRYARVLLMDYIS